MTTINEFANGSEHRPPRSLKTLSRKDSDFLSHLDGSFSADQMALPVRSLNVGLQTEEVTFEILNAADVSSPGFLKVATALIRPYALILSAGPMLAALARAHAGDRPINLWLAVSCFIGVLCFQMATNLFNDYGDHMKGQDRVRPKGGSRAIQNGWVRAKSVRKAAIVLLLVAAACGVPAVVRSPVIILAGLALLFTMEFAFQRLRLKARGWAEGIAFLLTGPLLTCGFLWAVTGSTDLGDATLGCVFGALSLLYFHAANFENIMVDSQAGARTWATRTGFDASKTFYIFVAVVCVSFSLFHILVIERAPALLPVAIVQMVILVVASKRVRRLSSPLSSELVGLRDVAVQLSWLTTLLFITDYVWAA